GASAEAEVALAREALEEGDHAHAATHAAAALAFDPSRSDLRALLDEIIEAAEEPRDLFPIEKKKGGSFVHVAGHAYVAVYQGETQCVIDVIAQVAAFVPLCGYEAWAVEWIAAHEGRFDPRGIVGTLAGLIGDTVGFLRLRASEKRL